MLYQNEKMKKRYIEYCKGAKGYSDKTMKKIEGSIYKYDEYSKHQDYKKFNKESAKGFKKWLEIYVSVKNQPLDLSTQFHILRIVKTFFIWLSQQTGYKSRVHLDDIEYFALSLAQTKIATTSKYPDYPTLAHILKLTSFEIKNDIDLRDRALIAFTSMSAMRDLAVVTLPLGCYDKVEHIVDQNPKFGVKTKFSKTIRTKLFIFDDKLLQYFNSWLEILDKKHTFTMKEPIFPSTKIVQKSLTEHTFISIGITRDFWKDAGAMREIFKKRAEQMGLKYFSPHKFRHFAANEAFRKASNAEQMKAISQNLGHENLETTFFDYGAIDPHRLPKVIAEIDFKNRIN